MVEQIDRLPRCMIHSLDQVDILLIRDKKLIFTLSRNLDFSTVFNELMQKVVKFKFSGADLGEAGPSCLQWEIDSSKEIPHVVLGDTEIGGSWNSYDPEVKFFLIFSVCPFNYFDPST